MWVWVWFGWGVGGWRGGGKGVPQCCLVMHRAQTAAAVDLQLNLWLAPFT